ncbi:ATP-cone domain protein [Thermoanaerobacter mathranii subsp. mathranii str. A3]|jgi:transcriptional repressor NrdR|uniref:Transcriptional repressor NrdR n=4 Tax=Thermoanaerobacter TaxID=1754 RepID=NRDR_THEPX|nr:MULTISPECIES: transcriptional regulator NrdR [Thermoanaerobacter]B0K3F9.1 RecName: Full=Transcriptional repressor NrdR [Thermoanaerobacter sp. X514]KUJ90248.1 MAG: ATP-cone domain-containing protein [Thermoanaerobacter thermocopriae]HCD09615.1 transcriptional regulator NrdR [Thermoanaerobacter sp.]ABY93270.1 ATP-cone domain protein [Thermoanaerobacter sp. X514]ADD02727.1 ATP-cone domain protein [Thermoanaerobacter italicus Ab9]ADH61173.1 ATP-cone domain protein [Thermoanaerobacter mathrani
MKCPYCGYPDSKVIDSRPTDDNTSIRRRRECLKCGKRFTTYEKVEQLPILVIKKDNRREVYDRDKILKGMIKACEKRPVPIKVLEEITDEIDKRIINSMEREITSTEIGEMVMEKLKNVDEVAYVRFASVYRQFKDINTFMDELKKLLKESETKKENA